MSAFAGKGTLSQKLLTRDQARRPVAQPKSRLVAAFARTGVQDGRTTPRQDRDRYRRQQRHRPSIAELFAAEGAKTVLVARRAALLDEVAAGIKAKGGEALPLSADLTKEDAITALFKKAVETFGRLDVLVNNAGIATHKNTEDVTLDYWNEALAINITAPFLCAREAVRIMKAQQPQGGRIVNIGSVSAKTPRPDSLPYTVTKFGLQGMTHQLTMDGRKHNIVSSIIHPGATLSSFTARRGRTTAGPGERPDDYVMAAEEVAKIALLMATLPGEVNLYEATILPNHMRSFIGRG